MRKRFLNLAVLLFVVALLASGCGKKVVNDSTLGADDGANNQNQEQNNNLAHDDENDEINPSGTYTTNELLNMNRPMKCFWTESATNGGEVSNIIYINGHKFYQDVNMGDIGHAYTVSDGSYLYVWNDFTEVASKIKFSEMNKQIQNNSQQPATAGNAGLDQRRDFGCEKWLVDNSFFTPPSDKDFKDITEEMGEALTDIQENSGEYLKSACDLCKQAPTQELRDSCMGEMKCD